MIKDKLENAHLYEKIALGIKKGFDWLLSNDLSILSDGKYEIDGDKLYASVQTYTTKDTAKYESHRKYIDIQYVINGQEKIGVANLENCVTCIEYDTERDLEFYDLKREPEEYYKLTKGEFVVFYPHDAHKPSLSINEASTVKKVVVKVALDY